MTRLVDKADRKTARGFLQHMPEAVPSQVRTVLTGRATGTPSVRATMARGIRFAEQPRNRNTTYSGPMRLDMVWEGGTLPPIGPVTMVERHRAPPGEARPPLEFGGSDNSPVDCCPDKRAGRAEEQDDQGRDREALP